MDDYIKVFSYKKVIVGGICHDVLYLEGIYKGKSKKDKYEILEGKYTGKFISKLARDYQQHDFVAVSLSKLEKALLDEKEADLDSKDFFVSKYKANEYFYVNYSDATDQIGLQETKNPKIIQAFKEGLNPSVAELAMKVIEQSEEDGGSLRFEASLVNKMLGLSDTLLEQDSNKHRKTLSDFNIKESFQEIKKRIFGLDEELRILLAIITKNITLSYSSLDEEKISILKSTPLIIGSPGTGKTHSIKSIANLYDIPTAIEDATRYTPNAYQGESIEDMLVNLYYKVDKDDEKFSHSIIFIDEFDKICKKTFDEKDNNLKEQVQNSLLTLLQGTTINKKVREGLGETVLALDTSKMTFVLSGAFEELQNKDKIEEEDLIQYGMIRQLAARVGTIIQIPYPTKENLKDALKNGELSYLTLLEEYLALYNIPLEVTDEFIDAIVEDAYERKEGYRGLNKAVENCINQYLFDIYAEKITELKLLK